MSDKYDDVWESIVHVQSVMIDYQKSAIELLANATAAFGIMGFICGLITGVIIGDLRL